MTPVIEGFFTSICLDVFSLPPVEYNDQTFDCALVCVDRATNWVIAKPTLMEGLTGEKAAQMLLEGWGEIAIPSVLTSDHGAQFTSSFFRTICARLGVRQAFSQAYRPQANGRAEVAGRTLITTLRKLHTDNEINWVESLPRALRLRHDLPDPETGFTPYQLLFGRERPLANLPFSIARANPDAEEFVDGIQKIDDFTGKILQKQLQDQEERINRSRSYRHDFAVGDWVWIQRPTAFVGPKIQTSWQGPYQITFRTGGKSFRIKISHNSEQEVHADQIKPCLSNPDLNRLYPLVYRKGEPLLSTPEAHIQKVLESRTFGSDVEFLVEWSEFSGGGQGWVNARQLGPALQQALNLLRA